MQLKLSLITSTLLAAMALNAEDYVSIEYLQYNENQNRSEISAPSITINKDFGTDYTLNASLVVDMVSGASQTYYNDAYDGVSGASYDASSGASVFARGLNIDNSNIKYGNISYDDERVAWSALITKRFENRDELSIGASRSEEHDFYSSEASIEYMHWLSESKNNSLSFGISYQSNEILQFCSEITVDGCSGASQKREADAINTQMSFSQNIDMYSTLKLGVFYAKDSGYLDNPYLNVVRNYEANGASDVVGEHRPDSKEAYGAIVQYANALSDKTTLHLNYRYYKDDWQTQSHTIDPDIYYEFNDDWLFKIGLRYYQQSSAYFYNSSPTYFTDELYASSDQRLSDFNAQTYKSALRYKINDDISVNFGANFYVQSTDLNALYFVTGLKYNF
jgi:hypothetical protein